MSQPNNPWENPGSQSSPSPYGPPAGTPGYGQSTPPYGAGQPGQPYPSGQPGQPYGQPAGASGQPDQSYGANPYTQPAYPQTAGGGYGGYAGYVASLGRDDYAGWGKRVGAFLLDGLPAYIAQIPFYIGYVMFFITLSQSAGTDGTTSPTVNTPAVILMSIGGLLSVGALVWQIFNRWIRAGRTGQSWGKRVTKIKLVSEQTGQPIGGLNAFLRDLVHILDGMAYVGYLWPLWDDRRQTFSDKLMKTVVVHADRAS